MSVYYIRMFCRNTCLVSNNVRDKCDISLVFMRHGHTLKKKQQLSLEMLVSSDIRPFRNLTFYNILARQDSSFCNRALLSSYVM